MLGNIGSSISSFVPTSVTGLAKNAANSSYLVKANDSINRTVGVDIRRYMGGKTAAEIAEERLAKDSEQSRGFGGYAGGY